MCQTCSNTNSQNKLKTAMLRPSLYSYSDACILVNGTITVTSEGADTASC